VGFELAVELVEEVDDNVTGVWLTTTGRIGGSVTTGGFAVTDPVVTIVGGSSDAPAVTGRLGAPTTASGSSMIRGTLESRTVIALLKPIRVMISLFLLTVSVFGKRKSPEHALSDCC